jgi:protein-S-isoprenylcysteine O-methyltransferase Ste14
MSVLLQVHNILRWVLLILLILSIIRSFIGWTKGRELREGDAMIWLFTMIATHTTLLIGLILLFFGRFGILSSGLPEGVVLMKDGFYRFYWVEHPTGMILAAIGITLGRGQIKKQITDPMKYKRAFWFFVCSLLIILAMIPWPGREIVGRSF